MHANVGACIKISLELVPKFRRLILEVPLKILVSRRKVALFGPSSFFVAANTDDDRLVIFLLDDGLERVSFEKAAALNAGDAPVRKGFLSF